MARSTAWRAARVAVALATLAAAAPAHADERWQHRGGWGGGHDWHRDHDWRDRDRHDRGRGGGIGALGGALLGLGVGAAVGAMIAGQQRGYAPPPPAYTPAPPTYYAPPPPAYYGD